MRCVSCEFVSACCSVQLAKLCPPPDQPSPVLIGEETHPSQSVRRCQSAAIAQHFHSDHHTCITGSCCKLGLCSAIRRTATAQTQCPAAQLLYADCWTTCCWRELHARAGHAAGLHAKPVLGAPGHEFLGMVSFWGGGVTLQSWTAGGACRTVPRANSRLVLWRKKPSGCEAAAPSCFPVTWSCSM